MSGYSRPRPNAPAGATPVELRRAYQFISFLCSHMRELIHLDEKQLLDRVEFFSICFLAKVGAIEPAQPSCIGDMLRMVARLLPRTVEPKLNATRRVVEELCAQPTSTQAFFFVNWSKDIKRGLHFALARAARCYASSGELAHVLMRALLSALTAQAAPRAPFEHPVAEREHGPPPGRLVAISPSPPHAPPARALTRSEQVFFEGRAA